MSLRIPQKMEEITNSKKFFKKFEKSGDKTSIEILKIQNSQRHELWKIHYPATSAGNKTTIRTL
jgi:hypothetical protein